MILFLQNHADQLIKLMEDNFSFDAFGVLITCHRLDIPRQVAYYVKFSSPRKPITVARAKFVDSKARWTSIPEGRQKEAEGIGALIDQYLSRKE